MKHSIKRLTMLLVWLGISLPGWRVQAQGTAFLYQGRLAANGVPANGSYDFIFVLYTASLGGNQAGPILTNASVPVANGLFSTFLDFGNVFTGSNFWLDISVSTNRADVFTELSPRQAISPTPYAIFANTASNLAGTLPLSKLGPGTAAIGISGNAATATSASSATRFTGSLSGDVTGLQTSTTVATVGGQTAANVAGGASLANGATAANVANALVRRDGSGNFAGNQITAGTFVGNGASLTGLNAANISSGTLSQAQLPANVPLLNAALNSFGGQLRVQGSASGGFGSPLVQMQNTDLAGNTSPSLRLIGAGYSPNGVLSVSSQGTGLIAQFGNASAFVADIQTNGTFDGAAFNGNGAGLTGVDAVSLGGSQLTTSGQPGLNVNTNIYLNDSPLYLRSDQNHGLGYNGLGVTNFPGAGVQPDGPVLWGYTGGALGQLAGGAAAALSWDNTGVKVANDLTIGGNTTINGDLSVNNLTGNNTPGINYVQSANPLTGAFSVNSGATVALGSSFGNLKPAAGYFLILAYADVQVQDNSGRVWLRLYDVTSGQTELDEAAFSGSGGYAASTLTLFWVVPITAGGGYQNFAVDLQNDCTSTIIVFNYSVSVLYLPRLND